MNKRIFSGLLALVLMTGSLGVHSVAAAEEADNTKGTTYYVSTLDGNDNNDGLSEDEAFYSLDKINEITLQPGDQVLLEAGSVFTNGYLHIKGCGTEDAPIIIDRYGKGNDPRIDTNGQGVWYQDYGGRLDSTSHKYEGYVSSSILLYDTEYIEVRNLELTNKAPEVETVYNALDTMNRTGVAAVAQNIGTVDHIVLDGLNIHDVIGNVYDKHMNNGGIYFTVFRPDNEAATGISRYNDVLIQNCIVKDVNRWGIAVGYTIYWDKFQPAAISDDTIAKYGSGEVVIRNNYLEEIGGDAITLMYCDRPLTEYNVSKGAAKQINYTDYALTGSGRVAAGIWPWKCKDAVFQYNECFDMYANQDGQAWDADSGDGTVYQYNYSHNNGGGCVMFCAGQAINNIFRYNISYKESGGVMNNAGNPDAYIYNNTFYIDGNIDFIRTGMAGGGMELENNIIYYAGANAKTEDWYKGGNTNKYVYNNNLYYGYTNVPSGDQNAMTDDPMFVEAAEAPTAPRNVSALSGNDITHPRATAFDMFKLSEGSPAIDAGVDIENNGGIDFLGTELTGALDLGAIEYTDSYPEAKPANKDALQALYDSFLTLNKEDYTEESWDVLEQVMAEAKEILDNEDAIQEEVDQVASELYNAGEELVEAKEPWVNPFKDVAEGKWYYDAVAWGNQNGVVNGLKNDVFGVKENCTRGQIVTFIWRAMGTPEAKEAAHTFTDVVEGKYYYDAMLWAVENGIVTGLTDTTFGPEATCTRAEIATLLYRLAGEPAVTGECPFSDIEDGKWYTNAVIWAAEEGVVTGYDNGTFGRKDNVSREQTVTMLYRYFAE